MTQSLDRTAQPGPAPIRPYAFPEVVEGRLRSGMEIRVAPKVDLPVVTAMVVLDAGEGCAPSHLPGIAVLAGDSLEGGTEVRDGRELARALEEVGASFGTATGWDSTTVAISCLADRLAEALPLLAEMIRRPAFQEAEFDRYRAQRLATIGQRQMDPGALASDSFARFLYASGSTYARPIDGTEPVINAVTPTDARHFVEARYGPNGGGVVLVGDVDETEARALAEEHFGDWVGASAARDAVVAVPRSEDRAVHVVHRPGAVQSEIRVGHIGTPRKTSDYFALRILNLTLGGSFTSRLNLNLREKNGFTYGVRSRFIARRGPGPFVVSTAVENGVTAAAVREIHSEIGTLAEEGPTPSEVEAARSYLAGVFPLTLETTGQLASRIAELLIYDLEPGYYQGYRDRVRAVTLPQTLEAATRRLRPSELCTVVVGDADAVASDLEGGDFGPVTVHA